MELFERIINWNLDRDNMTFDHFHETKMLAEELFEFCGLEKAHTKTLARQFAQDYAPTKEQMGNLSMSDTIDALGDIVFVAIGTIAKLGYNPHQVLTLICDANDQKGKKKDASGKIIKDETFVEPVHG